MRSAPTRAGPCVAGLCQSNGTSAPCRDAVRALRPRLASFLAMSDPVRPVPPSTSVVCSCGALCLGDLPMTTPNRQIYAQLMTHLAALTPIHTRQRRNFPASYEVKCSRAGAMQVYALIGIVLIRSKAQHIEQIQSIPANITAWSEAADT